MIKSKNIINILASTALVFGVLATVANAAGNPNAYYPTAVPTYYPNSTYNYPVSNQSNNNDALIPGFWTSPSKPTKFVPNCQLRREYNDYTFQWTTNEVCYPSNVEVNQYSNTSKLASNYGSYNTSNSYNNNSVNNSIINSGLIFTNNVSNSNNSYVNYTTPKASPSINYVPARNTSAVSNYRGYYANNPYTTGSGSGYYTDSIYYYTPTIYDYDYGYDRYSYNLGSVYGYDDEDDYPYYGNSIYDNAVESYYNSYGDSYFDEPSYANETYSSWAELDGYDI